MQPPPDTAAAGKCRDAEPIATLPAWRVPGARASVWTVAALPTVNPGDDDEDEDEDEDDGGSGGGNIDPDEDEGIGDDEEDDDEEDPLWAAMMHRTIALGPRRIRFRSRTRHTARPVC